MRHLLIGLTLLAAACVERALPFEGPRDGGGALADLSTETPEDLAVTPDDLACPFCTPDDLPAPIDFSTVDVITMPSPHGNQGCFDLLNCYFGGQTGNLCQDPQCFAKCDSMARSNAVIMAARAAEQCIVSQAEGPCGMVCQDPSDMGQSECIQCIYGTCSQTTGVCQGGPCSQPYDACLMNM